MFVLNLKKNKRYKFCSCGVSKNMPFCDNEHRKLNSTKKVSFKSIKVTPDKNVSLKVESKKWTTNSE